MLTNIRPGGLWLRADFRRLWAARTVSLFGSEITRLALPLVAALDLGASPAEMGVLAAAGTIPYLLFGLLAGVWVDRARRRPVLIGADIGRALLLALIPLAWALGKLSLVQLYAVAFAAGALTLLADVADNAYLPSLLRPDELVEGNSKLAASAAVAEGGGPALAGVLLGFVSAPLAVLLDATSFAASALLLRSISAHEPSAGGEERGLWREVGEGLRVVLREPVLRILAAVGAVLQLSGGAYGALLVLYVTRTLGLPPAVVGLLFAVGSASALAGAFAGGGLARRLGPGPAVAASALLISIGWLAVPLAVGQPTALVATMVCGAVLFGIGNTTYNVNAASIRQAVTPNRLLGRVGSAGLFFAWGALPVGALLGGLLGSRVGVREALLAAGLIRLPLVAWVLFSPLRAMRRLPEAPDGHRPVAAAGSDELRER